MPYRIGRPGALGAPCSTISRRWSSAAHHVVGVDAADALDGAARHRLAIGHDGERLHRRRGQPDRVRADVAGDEARRSRAPSPARPGRREDQAGCRGRGAPPRGRRGGRRPSRGPSRRAPRSRAATAAARRRTGAPRGRPRSGRRPVAPRASVPASDGLAPDRDVVGHANDSRSRRSGTSAATVAASSVARGDDRTPRLVLLDDDLAPLHELQHGQERDRDDDPVAHAAQQVLEHDRRARAERRADDRRPLGRG